MKTEKRQSTAQKIRAALKKAGFNTKELSIRTFHYSKVIVEIKNPDLDFDKINDIAESFEKIDWCPHTQEILAGGNTFVSVKWSDEAREAIEAKFLPALEEAAEKLGDKDDNSLIPIMGTKNLLGRQNIHNYGLWNDSFITQSYTLKGLCTSIEVRHNIKTINPWALNNNNPFTNNTHFDYENKNVVFELDKYSIIEAKPNQFDHCFDGVTIAQRVAPNKQMIIDLHEGNKPTEEGALYHEWERPLEMYKRGQLMLKGELS